MRSVIADNKWKEFCARRDLPLGQATFAVATCYYGIGFRTRPGTLILTSSEIIHHSYSWRDTQYAIFEPSIRILIPLPDIDRVIRRRFGFWSGAWLTQPEGCFVVVTRAGESHHLVPQRDGDKFMAALGEAHITFHNETVA